MLSIFYAISTYDDLRSFIKTFIYFIEIYILMTMCYYFYFKYAAGAFFSGICYTMFYPYYYATLVLAITPISLYLYFTSEYKNPKEKLNFLILFLICCLNVFLTSSRIAQITLIISVFVMLCHFYRLKEHKPEAKMIVSIFLIALLVGGLFATDAFFRIAKSFSTQENFDLHDENGRLNIYKGALKTFLDYPLTGVGPALSSMFITKYRVSKLCITDCHNIVLNRLCETGIFYAFFSFSVLLTTLYLTFKFAFLNGHTVKTDGPNGGDNNLSSAALASFMSLLVVYLQGFSMPHSFLTSLVYLEYIIIALCISSVKIAGLKNYSGGQSVTNVID
ncbi:MAG TPA: O-antigen ligase family protein, partial [Candidatus Wallbacteria bacterium]|nr:O-antigen ligase family protein [Candidatus Wallbacteria bacterium]